MATRQQNDADLSTAAAVDPYRTARRSERLAPEHGLRSSLWHQTQRTEWGETPKSALPDDVLFSTSQARGAPKVTSNWNSYDGQTDDPDRREEHGNRQATENIETDQTSLT